MKRIKRKKGEIYPANRRKGGKGEELGRIEEEKKR